MSPSPSAGRPSRPVVAAFDLDDTLARGDTLSPFLRLVAGRARLVGAVVRSAPAIARAARDRAARDDAKERVLRSTLRGYTVDALAAVAARYAPTVPLRDDVIAALRDHQAKGHETLIISASPTIYVRAIADHLGIDHVVATELEVVDGVLTGRYAGRNCRHEEKLRRLLEWLGDREVELHAYGNSPDDDAMLARADHPHHV
ncbi:MAG TPA: HAD-IB family hydrolase [Acidimicrobiales bacterium]|nr:HAD-IB family hydrolase [Acidimicrobiales bacterium]